MFEIIRLNLINPRVLKATVTQFAREDVGLLRDDFAQKDFKISPPFRISTINYASFNVTLIHLMLDHGIFRDIFGSQQLRAKILSNSWQEAKPVQRAMTGSYGTRKKAFNYLIVRLTQCISFFQYVCFPLLVMTHCDTSRGRHSRRLSCLLGLFMFARIACLLQL